MQSISCWFCRIPGPSGHVCEHITWSTKLPLGTSDQLSAKCGPDTGKVIPSQQAAWGNSWISTSSLSLLYFGSYNDLVNIIMSLIRGTFCQHRVDNLTWMGWTPSLLTSKLQWKLTSQQPPNPLLVLWGLYHIRTYSKCVEVLHWTTFWLIAGGRAVTKSLLLCFWLTPAYSSFHLKLWVSYTQTTFPQLQEISLFKCFTTELPNMLQKIQVSGPQKIMCNF